MRENRGLSLVELLVTIAILAIVIAAATSFMITGSRSFAKGNADSELQKEAELAVNQIEDMIIDVNGGMNVTDDETEVTMYHAEVTSTGTDYTGEIVQWNQSEEKLYYDIWTPSFDESTGEDTAKPAVAVTPLAENVAAFEVELDTENETALDGTVRTYVRSVQIRVGYENSTGGVDYATSPIITLRNRMLLSGDPTEIFEDFEASDTPMSLWYSGAETSGGIVPIIDRSSGVTRGGTYTIYARLTNGTDVSRLVSWELETTNSMSTIDGSGILKVGASEPNEYLTVTAKYKNNPSKKATGTLKVVGDNANVKSLTGISINERWRGLNEASDPFRPLFGSQPSVVGDWKTDEIAAIAYTWEIISGEQYVDSYTQGDDGTPVKYSTLDVTIKKEPASYGKTITLKLTAHSDVTGETVSTIYTYTIAPEGTKGGDSNMKRGMGVNSGHGNINYSYETEWPDRYSYEYYFCDEYGNKTSAYDDYFDSIIFRWSNPGYYTLTFDESLPLNMEFYVRVTILFEKDEWAWDPQVGDNVVVNTKTWSYDRIHHIPAVSMYDRHEYNYFNNGMFDFYYGVLAFWEVSWPTDEWSPTDPVFEYTIEELDYDSPDGVIVTPVGFSTYCIDVERIRALCTLKMNVDNVGWDQIEFKHIRVKVSLKEHPEISTDVNIYFS